MATLKTFPNTMQIEKFPNEEFRVPLGMGRIVGNP